MKDVLTLVTSHLNEPFLFWFLLLAEGVSFLSFCFPGVQVQGKVGVQGNTEV